MREWRIIECKSGYIVQSDDGIMDVIEQEADEHGGEVVNRVVNWVGNELTK